MALGLEPVTGCVWIWQNQDGTADLALPTDEVSLTVDELDAVANDLMRMSAHLRGAKEEA